MILQSNDSAYLQQEVLGKVQAIAC